MSGPTLFDLTRAERFERFHAENPQVFAALRDLALRAKARGAKVGVRLLWERLRWELEVEVRRTEDGPRLNDHYPPFYARLLNREPGLADYFETRGSR